MPAFTYSSPPIPRDLVGSVVAWRGYEQVAPGPTRHLALPDPIVPLVFGFDSVHLLESTTECLNAASFGGGLTESTVEVVAPIYRGLQVDLSPMAAARLVGAPGHELTARLFEIGDLFGVRGQRLTEQLETTRDWSHRFELLTGFLRWRLEAAPPAQPDVEQAWSLLEQTNGRIAVADLAGELGWSERRLRTRFSSHVGLPPKRAARLWRFRHAVRVLTMRPDLSLATVAARCGYFDQAHMSNEVTRMSGLTATALRGHGPGGVFED